MILNLKRGRMYVRDAREIVAVLPAGDPQTGGMVPGACVLVTESGTMFGVPMSPDDAAVALGIATSDEIKAAHTPAAPRIVTG